jgi:hypothetical protein
MNRRGLALLVSAAALALPVTVNSASADIAVGFQLDNQAIVPQPIVCIETNVCSFGGSFNGFTVTGSLQGSPPLSLPQLLQSQSTQATATADGLNHIVHVYITEFNNFLPTGSNNFGASLTANSLSGGATTLLEAAYDSTNALFSSCIVATATCTPLGSHLFTDIGTFVAPLTGIAITTPYSVTSEFTYTGLTVGDGANSTINITVPGPIVGAGLPGLFAACIGLIGLARARRRRQKTA